MPNHSPSPTTPGKTPDAAGLYVHVPFCSAICPYCDFAVTRAGEGARRLYVERVAREAELWGGHWEAGAFGTVYLGGGTPSILEAEALETLLDALRRELPVAPPGSSGPRLFLEANPEDVTAERLEVFRALGVGTLSLGVQSFDRSALKFLGRRHTPEQAERSVELALAAGFETVSVDLIFGLPPDREDPGALERSLERLIGLRPHHVSCYQLTVHEGTPFARGLDRGVIRELPETAQADAYERLCGRLMEAGYAPYEVSNFALTGKGSDGRDHRSEHNRKYWRHAPYLGLGPSAHSFVPLDPLARTGRRWWNERSVEAWGERVDGAGSREDRPVAGVEELGPADMALEALMLGLRTVAGIDLARFEERFGVDLVARNREVVERLIAQGLVELDRDRLRPTVQGLAVADGLPGMFEVEVEPGGSGGGDGDGDGDGGGG